MKLFITTGIYHPDIGGPATYLKNILFKKNFSEIPKYLLTLSDQKKLIMIENKRNLKIIRIKRKLNIFIRGFLIIIYLIKYARNCDVLYANGLYFETNLFSIIFHKKYIAKIVGDYHWERFKRKNLFSKSIEDFNRSKNIFIIFIKIIRKLTFSNCIKIIVPSNYLKKVVYSWNLRVKKIEIIYNSIDIKEFNYVKPKSLLKKINFQKGDKIICTISRLAKHKNITDLLDVINYKSNIKHIIIGEGPVRKEIENKIKKLNLKNNVFLLGSLNKSKTYSCLKISNFFILYSSYEGFAHVILEAMYFNNIVIATNVGGNKEIIKNNENGYLINFNDKQKMNEILSNNSKLKIASMKKKQKKTIEKFNNNLLIKNTINSLNLL